VFFIGLTSPILQAQESKVQKPITNAKIENVTTVPFSDAIKGKSKLPFDLFFDFNDGSFPTEAFYLNGGNFNYQFNGDDNDVRTVTIQDLQPVIVQNSDSFENTPSVRSANVSGSNNVAVAWGINFPEPIGAEGGTLDFKLRVSTESTFDFFHLCINGVCADEYQRSGDIAWADFPQVNLTEGDSTIAFVYTKDISQEFGLDGFLIDNISIIDNSAGASSQLSITDVQPKSGIPGTRVEIFGTGFDADATQPVFEVNGVTANLISYQDEKAVIEIPVTNVGPADISVIQNTLGIATLNSSFSVLDASLLGNFSGTANVISSSLSPRNLNVSDFDNDGISDVLVSFQNAGEISWFPGNGDGTFGSKIVINNTITAPLDHSIGDFDGDGDYDFATVSFLDSEIWWWPNNGSGSFASPTLISNSLIGPSDILPMDVDIDGDIDLVVVSPSNGSMVWYPNDGFGNFGAATSINSSLTAPSLLQKGDINNDGFQDIIVAPLGNPTNLIWFINNGGGSFSSEIAISGSLNDPNDIKTGDIDGDGLIDIAVTSTGNDEVSVFYNDGFNDFVKDVISLGDLSTPRDIELADLDSDGDIDIIIPSSADSYLTWYRNEGGGSFSEFTISENAFGASDVVALDYDLDGDLDLVSSFSGADILATLENVESVSSGDLSVTTIYPEAAIPGQSVDIFGYGFDEANLSVTFDGTPATVTNLNETRITVTIPNIGAGPRFIEVTNDDGSDSYNEIFTVINPQDFLFASISALNTSPLNQPFRIESFDVDEDDDLDLIYGSNNDNTIQLLRNNGDNTYAGPELIVNQGGRAYDFDYGDFDNDGFTDLIAISINTNEIFLYLNDQAGSFGSGILITNLGSSPRSVEAADFDGDGNMDIVYAAAGNDRIAWVPGNGDGTFETQILISQSLDAVVRVHVADMNNDGDMDVLAVNTSSTFNPAIGYFDNDGSGNFSFTNLLSSTANFSDIAAIDINDDNILDIITITGNTNELLYYLGNGNGTFQPITNVTSDLASPTRISQADYNGDGRIDFAIGVIGSSEIEIFENLGNTTFNRYSLTNAASYDLISGDMDNDGDMDIVSVDLNNGNINFFGNEEFIRFGITDVDAQIGAPGSSLTIYGTGFTGNGTLSVQIGGINATVQSVLDNKGVVTVPDVEPGFRSVRVSNNAGERFLDKKFTVAKSEPTRFGSNQGIILQSTVNNPRGNLLSDLDDDGDLDVIGAVQNTNNVFWLRNEGDKNFLSGGNLITGSLSNGPTGIDEGDFDRDGDQDIVISNVSGSNVVVLVNNGNDSFTPLVAVSGVSTPEDVIFADLNSDGYLDLVYPSRAGNYISWSQNNRQGGFGGQQFVSPSFNGTFRVRAGDLDNDGDLDIIATTGTAGIVAWFENLDEGIFSDANIISSSTNSPLGIDLADLDNDGDLDVVVGFQSSGTLNWYSNNGSGSFGAPQTISSSIGSVFDVRTADLNGDGDADIVTSSLSISGVFIHENLGSGQFATEEAIATNQSGAADLSLGDIDSDGDFDILLSATSGNRLVWFENLDPIAPQNLTATENNLGIVLNWQAPEGLIVGGYNVYRSSSPIENLNSATRLTPVPIPDLFLSDQSVLPNQEYYYVVAAVEDGTGIETAASNQAFSRFKFKSLQSLLSPTVSGGELLRISASNLTNISSTSAVFESGAGSFNATVISIEERTISIQAPFVNPGTYGIRINNDGTELTLPEFITVVQNDRGFYPAIEELNSYTGQAETGRLGDLDADGDLDLIVLYTGENNSIGWFENFGADNGFGDYNLITSDFFGEEQSGGLNREDIRIIDVDVDGNPDIVFTDNGDFSIYWLKNLGNAQFSDPQIIQGQDLGNINNIEMIDIDKDADPDIVFSVIAPGTSTLYYQINTGKGDFDNAIAIEANNTTLGSVGELISTDLDGNGLPDFVYAGGGGIPAYYLNTGSGFGLRNEFILPTTTGRFVDAGDFNNDLISDLIILASDSQSNGFAYLYTNDGTPNLSLSLTSPFIAAPDRVVAADISGDGLDDLVLHSESEGNIYTIISEGSGGSVTDITNLSFSSNVNSKYFELGDLDGDGDLDIVSVNESGDFADITIHRNTDPPPAPPVNVTATQRIGRIELDWDDNGETDLAGYRVLRRLAGEPVSFFITEGLITDSFFVDEDVENNRAYEYFIGAFDQTGNANYTFVDSVIAIQPKITGFLPSESRSGSDIRILGFGFASVTVSVNGVSAFISAEDSAFVDLTLPASLTPGPAEVILTSEGYADTARVPFTVLRNTDGVFNEGIAYSSDTFTGNLTAADVDNDGDLDLLETFPDDSRLDYRLNNGAGQFGSLNTLSTSLSTVLKTEAINIRGSNYPDFVSLPRASNLFHLLLNNGTVGDVGNTYEIIPVVSSNSLPADIEVADMNRDGRQDVIISSTLDNKINYYPNLSHSDTVLFGSEIIISTNASGPIDIEITDVNNDGRPDVIAAEVVNNTVSLYIQQIDGSFTKTTVTTLSGITDIEVMDIDLDGFQDIITSSNALSPARVQANRNNGSGTFFDETVLVTFPEDIRKMDTGDLDGDGDIDFILSGATTTKVFLNQGSANFTESAGFEDPNKSINDMIAFDSDGDGDLDFATRSAADGITNVHRNIVQTAITVNQVQTPAGNNRIAPRGSLPNNTVLNIVFNENLSDFSQSAFLNYFSGDAITYADTDGITSNPTNISFNGSALTIGNENLYSTDQFNFTLNSQTIFENSLGEIFVDGNGNGQYDGISDNFDSQNYEVALMADYDLSGAVWVSDLSAFSDAWVNGSNNYELAPFITKPGFSYPKVRPQGNNVFDVDDLVTFIRFWNLSIQLNKVSDQTQAKLPIAQLKVSNAGDSAIRLEKKSAETIYTPNGSILEINYGIKLNNSRSLKALGLEIDFNPNQVSIQSVSDSKVFDVLEESNTVMLSHIDSTAGKLYVQAANFGKRAPAFGREIAEIKIRSLDATNSELQISSELIPVDGESELAQVSASLDVSSELPQQFELSQNFPNPFNPSTSIQYQLPENARVSLAVFDVLGRKVQQLVDGDQTAGYYNLNFDARNLASGVYFYIIRAESLSGNSFSRTRKMTLIK
jgi:hypothetical protein